MTRPLDLLLWHMQAFAGSDDKVVAGFARSMLAKTKRPSFKPTPKQRAFMESLVNERFGDGDDFDVIEEVDAKE